MQIFLLLFFLVLVSVNALIDGKEIKSGKPINHTIEYFIFLIFSIFITYVSIPSLIWWKILAYGFIGSTITRAAFFNFILNLARGFSITFQSTTTTSKVDQIEQWIESKLPIKIYDWYISVFFILVYIALFFIPIIK